MYDGIDHVPLRRLRLSALAQVAPSATWRVTKASRTRATPAAAVNPKRWVVVAYISGPSSSAGAGGSGAGGSGAGGSSGTGTGKQMSPRPVKRFYRLHPAGTRQSSRRRQIRP